MAAPLLCADNDTIPLWVEIGALHGDLARHAVRRLAHRARRWASRITKLRPVGGFCAETGGAIAILIATHFGIPVSTTHTITGAIVGRRRDATRLRGAVGIGDANRVGLDPDDPDGRGDRGVGRYLIMEIEELSQ